MYPLAPRLKTASTGIRGCMNLRGVLSALFAMSLAFVGLAAGSAHADAPSGTVWLCRPGLANDPCTPDLTTTRYDNRGRVHNVYDVRTAPNANKVDCFYVYPTTSDEKTLQADFAVTPELRSIALYQAARYSSECRVFAPVYRQITILGLGGGATPEMRETAYQDVRSAFFDYLAHDNDGRGIVFIGHSQGAGVLRRLLREEVDPNPSLRDKLVSAILLGGNVTVAKGSDIGGDFQNIPACRSNRQVGCVIAFSTFDAPVPETSRFGRTSDPNLEVLCTNPAGLRRYSHGRISPISPTEPFAPGTVLAAAITLLGQPPITATTPWVETRDAYEARCVTDTNGANVLQLAPLGNAPVLNPSPDATWGLHLVDANIALRELVADVHAEATRWLHFHRDRHHHRSQERKRAEAGRK